MKRKQIMNRMKRFLGIILLASVNLNASYLFAQNPQTNHSPQAQATSTGVVGSGTTGQLTKWTGVSGENTFNIGNSIITETKFGLIGIGTTTPSSKLSVAGIIESLSGGFKFPDGSIQTTAALSSIFHDATLLGNGTAGSPLGIALGGVGTLQLANNAVTGAKIANGNVVRSFNGLFDNIQLAAGANITITPTGNTLTIAAPNTLTSIFHDATLTGNGTGGSLLGIARGGVGNLELADTAVTTDKLDGSAVTAPKINTPDEPLAGQFLSFDGKGLIWQTPAAAGAVVTDQTLAGNGAAGSPLKVAVPLSLSGIGSTILTVTNLGGANAIFAKGGDDNLSNGGDGVQAAGGNSTVDDGGSGLFALGGSSTAPGHRSGDGIFAIAGSGSAGATNGEAGSFLGDVSITGSLNVLGGTKNFKIDHPLDPANKYLYHAAVESSEVLNVYSGNITTDTTGEASITLPEWFEAINKDFRYQLTVVGQFAQAIVAGKIKNNRFTIRTNTPNVEVSWQVTGVRSDAAMLEHPFKVEEDKAGTERGHYLTPEAFGQPEEKSVQWAQHPAIMKQLKEKQEQLTRSQQR